MGQTVVGMYDDLDKARQAVQDLENSGFKREDISLVANDAQGDVRKYSGTEEKGEKVASGAAGGAGVGAVVGGIGGLLVGLAALAIPGVGPIVAAGPIATTLAGLGVGAAAGGIIGALTQAGVPKEEANYYAEGIKRGGNLVMVHTSDDMADQASAIMNRYDPVDIDQRAEEWRASGWKTGTTEQAQPRQSQKMEEGETTLPVVEEQLQVSKRQVHKGGGQIRTYVTEHPVEQQVNLRQEHVDVERHPVDRPATDADEAFQEQTVEVDEMAEEPVVRKQANVVEEVTVRKRSEEHPETVSDSVRRTEVDTGQYGRDTLQGNDTFDSFKDRFRQDFDSRYAKSGYTYDQYEPYYRYGYDLGTSDEYQGQDWPTIEQEIRDDWTQRYPDQSWSEFRDPVRVGWEAAHSNM